MLRYKILSIIFIFSLQTVLEMQKDISRLLKGNTLFPKKKCTLGDMIILTHLKIQKPLCESYIQNNRQNSFMIKT